MRLLSALLAALTALLTFYFLRQILPRAPWAATVGALCVALQPLLASTSGEREPGSDAVSPPPRPCSCASRARSVAGSSTRLALALGLVIAVGFATKVNYVGVALGCVSRGWPMLAVRGFKAHRWAGLRSPAIAAAIGIAPVALYRAPQRADEQPGHRRRRANRRPAGARRRCSKSSATPGRLFLPRLPGMTPYFKGVLPLREIWFDRSVGFYGWMDTTLPDLGRQRRARAGGGSRGARAPGSCSCVATRAESAPAGARGLRRDHRWGCCGCSDTPPTAATCIEHAMLARRAALPAAAAAAVRRGDRPGGSRRGAKVGARWSGAAMVVLFLGHDLLSQLQTIARYYG